ncbi:MAG: signal peptidase II [Dehalococcoidia bacterium]|jgi:signal peptidase II|nr:signal peptidase II [Dehalococcoidia bacterium]
MNKIGLLSIASIIIVLDQISKIIVRNNLDVGDQWPTTWRLFHISHIQNSGGIFGSFQNMNSMLLIVSIVILIVLLTYALKLKEINHLELISIGLIIGGGVGNILDRIFIGSVTDFIDPIYYPAFNLADSSIVIGIAVYALNIFRLSGHHDKKN